MAPARLGLVALVTATVPALTPVLVPANAEGATWNGEGSVSASATTGNTETINAGVGIDVDRRSQLWTLGLEALLDYGETDGLESENRFFLAGQLDRQFSDRMYGFARMSYERDEFSGFESRSFVGGGVGYQILKEGPATWSVEGGPGLKIDEVRATIRTQADGTRVPVEATTEESVSAVGASNFEFDVNDNVVLSNKTDVLYAEESTQLGNVLALTATLTQTLSARISFDVRHDTNPPGGFESTDTATRFSLVYTLGE